MIKPTDVKTALDRIKHVESIDDLNNLRLEYLGRKGALTIALREIGHMSANQRAVAGQSLNAAKQQLEDAIKERQSALLNKVGVADSSMSFDMSAPAAKRIGHLHPIEELKKEIAHVFWQLGFYVADGPEIETDWHNFEALNIPKDHPARDMQDTFYLENGAVVRTHTSSMQIRYMESHKPPIRIIVPGKAYRNEDEDATHAWAFQQIEALVVDEGITLADLKGTILYMLKAVFGDSAELKVLPSFFPYTEPSLEVHARLHKQTEWLELGGAGMVHPQVLRNVGIDPQKHSGFAYGFGFERLAAIKYGLTDIRHFWRPNLKFLEQF